jgi:Tfp pilus assembly protein PilF
LYELGKLDESQENWPRARQTLEKVIELDPQFAAAHYQLSRVYAHLGQTAKAEQEARETHTLLDGQRDEALRKQRERAASFQPHLIAAAAPAP